MRIILGSSSPRRKDLLKQIIDTIDIYSPEIDESFIKEETPVNYSERISKEKAKNIIPYISSSGRPTLLITCDTIVTIDNIIIGKPAGYNDAVNIFNRLNGRTHEVISSITLIYKGINYSKKTESQKTQITFKNLNDGMIKDYLYRIDFMDKAGGYAIQEHGDIIIKRVMGSITNVIGFPLTLFFKMLSEMDLLDKIFIK